LALSFIAAFMQIDFVFYTHFSVLWVFNSTDLAQGYGNLTFSIKICYLFICDYGQAIQMMSFGATSVSVRILWAIQ